MISEAMKRNIPSTRGVDPRADWCGVGGCSAWPWCVRRLGVRVHQAATSASRTSTSTCSTGKLRVLAEPARPGRGGASRSALRREGRDDDLVDALVAIACMTAAYGSGCAIWPCASMPSLAELRERAPQPPLRLRVRRLVGSLCGRDDQEARRQLRGALPDLVEQRLAERPSRSRRRARCASPLLGSMSTTTCSNGRSPATRAHRGRRRSRRSQPDFCCGCVETMISSGGSSWAIASRSALTGIGLDDEAVRGDRLLAEELERLVEPAAGGGAARVVVDDVALPRLVDRGRSR